MPDQTRLISFPSQGQHTEVEKVAVPTTAFHTGINVRTEKQSLKQRLGTREIPWVAEGDLDIDEVQQLNFQSAITFTPETGSSAIQFSDKGSRIILAAGGRKFQLRLVGGKWNSKLMVSEITGGAIQSPQHYQVYMEEAENYVVSGDDFSGTWIYREGSGARFSDGYTNVIADRADSEVPNNMRLPLAAHNRLIAVVGDRSLLVGDIIHGADLTDPEDIIKFTEQTYWAEGQRFVLPSEAGRIISIYSLPVHGENTRHGDVIIEAEKQTWSLDLDVFPRREWANQPLLRLVSAEGGAQGQFAFDVYNNDAIRRTQSGIETLSFSNQVGDSITAPQKNISYPMWEILKRDEGTYLNFSSLKMHRRALRFYATIRPRGNDIHWGSRAWISYNYLDKVWDGIWTPPLWAEKIKIFLRHPMKGQERMLMVAGGGGKEIRFLEIDEVFKFDYDENGRAQPIESQVEPRSLFYDLNERVLPETVVAQWSEVQGDFSYSLDWKPGADTECWTEWESVNSRCTHSNQRPITHTFKDFQGREVNSARVKTDVEFQFRLVWRGPGSLRFMDVQHTRENGHFDDDEISGESCEANKRLCCDEHFRYTSYTS